MFEYHAWAMLEPEGGSEAEDALADALNARIAELDDATRESFRVTRLNALMVHASGLRNRTQGAVLSLFEWLARECPQAYGLIYFRGEDLGADGLYRFEVMRIHRGTIQYLEDRYFTDAP
ncbi:Imm7 family immunity protein [Longimicrobium sp.]|uniref:Imm7 family immunity protein n=1 Tax=Longimicrobium sp. TaxID=2029185 RepID=UPI003B3B062A